MNCECLFFHITCIAFQPCMNLNDGIIFPFHLIVCRLQRNDPFIMFHDIQCLILSCFPGHRIRKYIDSIFSSACHIDRCSCCSIQCSTFCICYVIGDLLNAAVWCLDLHRPQRFRCSIYIRIVHRVICSGLWCSSTCFQYHLCRITFLNDDRIRRLLCFIVCVIRCDDQHLTVEGTSQLCGIDLLGICTASICCTSRTCNACIDRTLILFIGENYLLALTSVCIHFIGLDFTNTRPWITGIDRQLCHLVRKTDTIGITTDCFHDICHKTNSR